jgi:hypothetical protein
MAPTSGTFTALGYRFGGEHPYLRDPFVRLASAIWNERASDTMVRGNNLTELRII